MKIKDIARIRKQFPDIPYWMILALIRDHGSDTTLWKNHPHFMARCGKCKCEYCKRGSG